MNLNVNLDLKVGMKMNVSVNVNVKSFESAAHFQVVARQSGTAARPSRASHSN